MEQSINKERLWAALTALGQIGRQPDGGITRWPFTAADRAAGDFLLAQMQEAGLATHTDAAGNIIGEWPGTAPELPCVLTGSHYDTVRNGGMFDGALGLLAALEAVRALKEQGLAPRRTLRVVGFKDEEGNRFGYGMIGSKAITGRVDPAGLAARDADGITLEQAMTAFGLAPTALDSCRMTDVALFVELHIEQGRVLAEQNAAIGIVAGIAGLKRFQVEITGESGHAGATPMKLRRDPVPAMCRWIEQATALAAQQEGCVATVGQIETRPGVCNVICERVLFTLDIRALQAADMDRMLQQLQAFGEQLQAEYGVGVTMTETLQLPGLLCSPKLQERLKQICEREQVSWQPLMSGAGHDCMNFKEQCPTAMIFVPSKNGWSHRKEEYTAPAECAVGAAILSQFLREVLS